MVSALQFRVETGAGAHRTLWPVSHLAYEAEVYALILERLGPA